MNLYVPEIGDHIQLTADWRFILHAESRNEALGAFFGYYFNWSHGWIKETDLPKMREVDYQIKYPSDSQIKKDFWGGINYDARQKANKEAEENCPEFVKYTKDLSAWYDEAKRVGVKELDVIIPEGTILSIDRIYIRKGASDFSSITFYAKNLGEVNLTTRHFYDSKKKKTKKKSLRFWAKLLDCNKIEFDKIEKP